MRLKDRRVPTQPEAESGIPIALRNARAHIECAALLADHGFAGPATSFLILGIEETEKARTLGQIALGTDLTESELLARLFTHPSRYEGALWKSWSKGSLMTWALEALREELGIKPARSEDQRLAEVIAQHPEALPLDWAAKAGQMREAGLYVDLAEDGNWTSPADVSRDVYEELRRPAESLLRYVEAAFEREINLGRKDLT
jgi:AbiV family abortive infection protein